MASKKTKKGNGSKVGTGLAIGALAMAAGYYFYASKDAKKNRRIAAKWATDMKAEVLEKAENMKSMDKAKIAAAVDTVARAYKSAKNVDGKDLARAAKELKTNWKEIVQELSGPVKTAKKAAKKAARKSSKK